MERVEVEINPLDYPVDQKCDEFSYYLWCSKKLKMAGIPLTDFFIYQGVKSGTLTCSKQLESHSVKYVWTGDSHDRTTEGGD